MNVWCNIFHCIDGCTLLSSYMDPTMLFKMKKMLQTIDNCRMCSAKKFVLNFDQQKCFAPLYDSFTCFCYVRHTISKKYVRNYSMKEVSHEARSSWFLLLQVERIRLYEVELNLFLFVGQTQYLFGGSNFFVNIHRWVTSCFDCKFISFQKKND